MYFSLFLFLIFLNFLENTRNFFKNLENPSNFKNPPNILELFENSKTSFWKGYEKL